MYKMSTGMDVADALMEKLHHDAVDSSDGSSCQESEQDLIAKNRRELINAEYENLLSSGKSLAEVEDEMYCSKFKKSWERKIAERLFISSVFDDPKKSIKIVRSIITDLDSIQCDISVPTVKRKIVDKIWINTERIRRALDILIKKHLQFSEVNYEWEMGNFQLYQKTEMTLKKRIERLYVKERKSELDRIFTVNKLTQCDLSDVPMSAGCVSAPDATNGGASVVQAIERLDARVAHLTDEVKSIQKSMEAAAVGIVDPLKSKKKAVKKKKRVSVYSNNNLRVESKSDSDRLDNNSISRVENGAFPLPSSSRKPRKKNKINKVSDNCNKICSKNDVLTKNVISSDEKVTFTSERYSTNDEATVRKSYADIVRRPDVDRVSPLLETQLRPVKENSSVNYNYNNVDKFCMNNRYNMSIFERSPPSPAVIRLVSSNPCVSVDDMMKKAREEISLQEIGIESIRFRRCLSVGALVEVLGADKIEKTNRLCEEIRKLFVGIEGVRVYRPMKKVSVRLFDITNLISLTDIKNAIIKIVKCSENDITFSQVRFARNGLGAVTMQCPIEVARKLFVEKELRVEWFVVRLELLQDCALRCFRCLATGHTVSRCPSGVDRSGCCFRCDDVCRSQGCYL